MKIAFICTEKLPVPPILGGAIQIYIEGILPILARHHEITVISLYNDTLPEREASGNIRILRVHGKTRDEYVKNIKNLLIEEDTTYDLIHVFNRPRWVSRLSKAAPNTAFSLSLHNEMMLPKKIDPTRAVECIEKVEFISTVSQFIADGVKKLYPIAEDKLNVVYSAVDYEQIKPKWSEEVQQSRMAMRMKYGLESNKIILYIGRLGKKKGAHILIKAMEKVMKLHPEAALLFVGSKWYGSNATDDYVIHIQKKSKSLPGPVIFTGFFAPKLIHTYYNMGDIFVCASQWEEPLARVHYEAMAAGLPIITTNRGGNAEVIEESKNGLLLNEFDNPEAMAGKIIYLLEHEEKGLEMGRYGRKMVEEKYTFNRVAHQLLELFDIVSKKRGIKSS